MDAGEMKGIFHFFLEAKPLGGYPGRSYDRLRQNEAGSKERAHGGMGGAALKSSLSE
jgi:hypothetical protein